MSEKEESGEIDASLRLLNGEKRISLSDDLNRTARSTKNKEIVKQIKIVEKENGSSIRENETKKMQNWKLVPPDGGWGWLVLFGSTLVNILVPGTVKSFGVLFVEFLEVFEASPAEAAWIPALCYFLYSSLGPLSSILSVKYSYRTVTLLGGTFAAVGMMLSFFAGSVAYLYLSYGVLVGIGAGLSFPPTVYIVTSYFVRLRGLANGLCISGSAIGSIILPPVLRLMLEYYGYRGAILLMGGITLNVWVAALFYDPVEKHLKKIPSDETETEPEENSQLLKQSQLIVSDEENSASLPHNDSFIESEMNKDNNFNRSASSAAMQNYLKSQVTRERKVSVPTSRNEIVRARSSAGSPNHMTSSSTLHAVPETRTSEMSVSQNKLHISRRSRPPCRSPSTSSFQYVSTPYHGSTLTLQPETFASSFSLKGKGVESGRTKKKFFDLSLMKDPVYLIILISNSTNAISYTNFIILLPSYAQSLGFNKTKGALLLSVVSALDLVGRIGGSALSDLPLFPKEWYFIGGLLMSGISLAMMPFAQNYTIICVYCAVFGLASGVYVGITAVIMADMLGTERLESSYGISLFVNGVLQLIGPPLCGVWFEVAKSYISLYCTLGIVLIVGASFWSFMPCAKRRSAKNEKQTNKSGSA